MASFKTRAIFYCILGSLIVNSMSKVSATGFKLFIVGETEDTIMCRFDECENPFESKPRAHETSPLSSELQSTKINTQIVLEAYGSFIEVAFVFLNILFGIVLDMKKVKPMLKTPVGPGITFFADFILAPLLCYAICLTLFKSDNAYQRYNLFMIVAGSKGAQSICWTIVLGGNADLSVFMSTVNTILSTIMHPLWFHALGSNMLLEDFQDPSSYDDSFNYFIWCLSYSILPFFMGTLVQFVCPPTKKYSVPIAKWISPIFILADVIFTCFLYVGGFQLTTDFMLSLLVAGAVLSTTGYATGWFLATAFKQSFENCLTIAVESSIQNILFGLSSLPMVAHFIFVKAREKLGRRK